jgi:hypothetical protein
MGSPSNGEGGIRTLGGLAPTLVFETSGDLAEPVGSETGSDSGRSVVARLVARPVGETARFVMTADETDRTIPTVLDPDLAKIVAAWPTLAEPLKRAMLALIDSTR